MEGKDGRVEVFYNDTAGSVSKRVAVAETVELRGGVLVGVDANTGQGFFLPLQRVVRVEGDPEDVRRIVGGAHATQGGAAEGDG